MVTGFPAGIAVVWHEPVAVDPLDWDGASAPVVHKLVVPILKATLPVGTGPEPPVAATFAVRVTVLP